MNGTPRRRILIADDDPGVQIALRATLQADGYQTVAVTDGRAAMSALLNDRFDLAILDLAMPELDGLQVLNNLQLRRPTHALPPVLILTAHGSITAALDSARHGAFDFLHKPISPDSLRTAVTRALAAAAVAPETSTADPPA
jgi:DNA-binding NtrC family response regulator